MEPSGNNYVDQIVFINEIVGNQLFHKTGKYDSIVVAAREGREVGSSASA